MSTTPSGSRSRRVPPHIRSNVMSTRSWSMLRGSPSRFNWWASRLTCLIAATALLGGETAGDQFGGAVGSGVQHEAPLLHRCVIAAGSVGGVQSEGDPPQPGGELTGGQPSSRREHHIDRLSGGGLVEVVRPVTEHPGPGEVDQTGMQRLPDSGETLQSQSQVEGGVGCSPGEVQRCSDLVGGVLHHHRGAFRGVGVRWRGPPRPPPHGTALGRGRPVGTMPPAAPPGRDRSAGCGRSRPTARRARVRGASPPIRRGGTPPGGPPPGRAIPSPGRFASQHDNSLHSSAVHIGEARSAYHNTLTNRTNVR